MDEPIAITSEETFRKGFHAAMEDASRSFLEDGSIHHTVMAIDQEGTCHIVDFDRLCSLIGRVMGREDAGAVKSAAYEAISFGMVNKKMVGFIDVSEVWMIQEPREDFSEMIRRHGKDLGDVPGRTEGIAVCGRWRDVHIMANRQIRRLGDMPILEDVKIYEDCLPGKGRQMHLWKAIDEVTGSDLSKRAGEAEKGGKIHEDRSRQG